MCLHITTACWHGPYPHFAARWYGWRWVSSIIEMMLMLPMLVMRIFLLVMDATVMTRLRLRFRSWSTATVTMWTRGYCSDFLLGNTICRIVIEVGDAADFVWEGVSYRGSQRWCEMDMGVWIRAIATTALANLGNMRRFHRVHGISWEWHAVKVIYSLKQEDGPEEQIMLLVRKQLKRSFCENGWCNETLCSCSGLIVSYRREWNNCGIDGIDKLKNRSISSTYHRCGIFAWGERPPTQHQEAAKAKTKERELQFEWFARSQILRSLGVLSYWNSLTYVHFYLRSLSETLLCTMVCSVCFLTISTCNGYVSFRAYYHKYLILDIIKVILNEILLFTNLKFWCVLLAKYLSTCFCHIISCSRCACILLHRTLHVLPSWSTVPFTRAIGVHGTLIIWQR